MYESSIIRLIIEEHIPQVNYASCFKPQHSRYSIQPFTKIWLKYAYYRLKQKDVEYDTSIRMVFYNV